MIVLILERVPESLRGELTRWLLEPKACVFVGIVNAQVREKLWAKVLDNLNPNSGALLIHNDPNTDWGFRLRTHGTLKRRIVERDGLQLVQYDHPDRDKAHRKLRASIPPKLKEALANQLGVAPPETTSESPLDRPTDDAQSEKTS